MNIKLLEMQKPDSYNLMGLNVLGIRCWNRLNQIWLVVAYEAIYAQVSITQNRAYLQRTWQWIPAGRFDNMPSLMSHVYLTFFLAYEDILWWPL